jgi:hypothetical protein
VAWATLAGVLAIGCLIALASVTGRAAKPASGWVELQAGRYGSAPWRLVAREQDHVLCLSLESASDGDPTAGTTGGCGFNTDHPDSGYYVDGPGPSGVICRFGPLPARAVAVRVAPDQTIPTFVLPAGHGLPAARYWLFIPPPFWPNAALGPAPDPQPLDDQGNPVAFTRF